MLVIAIITAALAAASCRDQQDCQRGACYPPTGDLLVGRGMYLRASSTCGMTGSEIFCSPFGQWKMKCCPCDSHNPSGPYAHNIQYALPGSGPDRWWQSQKDVSPVTLQLDLHNTLQMDTLVLEFKGPRPDALVIEHSTDFGRTWQPALFMAADCRTAFPNIATDLPHNLKDTYCYPLPPFPTNPSMDQTIHFSPLRQYSSISVPQSQKVEAVTRFTNLRVNFTKPGQGPRPPGRSPSLFYALKEMRVIGSCFCHGHANRCRPETSGAQQVSAVCECQHNTAGTNCERCDALYNDLPWRPAEEGQTHTCKRCECHSHARSCRFDPVLFEASGRRSGGVCVDCMHYTTGPRCDRCASGYYRNPRSAIDRPDACLRCQCSYAGAEGGGRCNSETGECRCKANVDGVLCDRCKPGYYGLSAANPLGCNECPCNAAGSSSPCDLQTGQCRCLPNVQGQSCDLCAPGYWSLRPGFGCEPCRCSPTTSLGNTCNPVTGQCLCRPGYSGRTCMDQGCPENTYGDPSAGCRPCNCERSGTARCDKRTGVCHCLPGVTGSRCDACTRGHCSTYPKCQPCPTCYFSLERRLQNLTLDLQLLASQAGAARPSVTQPGLSPRILALEAALERIRSTMVLPTESFRRTTQALADLRRLRDQADRVDPTIFPTEEGFVLARELQDLTAILQGLQWDYRSKLNTGRSNSSINYRGAFSAIQAAYRDSPCRDAAQSSQPLLQQAAKARADVLALQGEQRNNTSDLEHLKQKLASGPDLTPVAQLVCGRTRSSPCTPEQCNGQLCPNPEDALCRPETNCIGALPLASKAMGDAEEVRDRLQQLNKKISQAAQQIQKAQESSSHVRLTADKLANQLKDTRGALESDMQSTRDLVKDLKSFLSDPQSDPAKIEAICEGVLNTKLPLSLTALKRKVEDIRRLAANLPDGTRFLSGTGPQLELARQLLLQAQDARDDAIALSGRVGNVLSDLEDTEARLLDAEGKLQDSIEQVNDASNKTDQAKNELTPLLKTIDEINATVASLKPQLENLKALVQNGSQMANQAKDQAEAAQAEAAAAKEGLQQLEKQLELLRQTSREATGSGDNPASNGERLQRLQEEASALVQETMDMMKTVTDKEVSLKTNAKEAIQKAQALDGLDTQLQKLLTTIRQKVSLLNNCQG